MNHHFDKDFKAETLGELCTQYGLDPTDATLIKQDSNLIYDCGDSILRVSHSDIRTKEDIEVELDWLDFLGHRGLSMVGVIRSVDNDISVSSGSSDVHFTAVCFEKISGNRISKATWNTTHFQNIGQLAGRLHRTSRDYSFKAILHYRHWDELIECHYAGLLPEDGRELGQLNDRLINEFRAYDRSPENYGMIHNDIHFENYLLTGPTHKIVLFDFEVACRSWHLYEIATALYYACLPYRNQNDVGFEQTFLSNFLIGYRTEYDLPPFEFTVILKFMLYRDLFLYGYLLAIWRHKMPPKPVADQLDRIAAAIAVRRKRLGW